MVGRERDRDRDKDRETEVKRMRGTERETARVHGVRDSIAGFMVPLASVETSSDTVHLSGPF